MGKKGRIRSDTKFDLLGLQFLSVRIYEFLIVLLN
jgi:hypothetical protein